MGATVPNRLDTGIDERFVVEWVLHVQPSCLTDGVLFMQCHYHYCRPDIHLSVVAVVLLHM
jgi:hypothetical protein